MLLEVAYSPATQLYHWKLWDGPDGIDERMGYCDTLQQCFERVERARTEISMDYL